MNILTFPRKLFLALHLGLIYICYFTYRTVARRFFPEIKHEVKWTLIVLYGYIVINYVLVWLSKPGPLRIQSVPDVEKLGIKHPDHAQQLQKTCEKCRLAWRPPRARHCLICGTCVFRLDHHSDWFNNCIGIKNQKPVVLFGVASALLALIVLAINITAFIIWTQQLKKPILEGGIRITFTKFVVLSLIILALGLLVLAANFIVGMFFNIRDNQTNAEQEDGDVIGRPADFETNFVQVFGRWGWWLPLPASVDVNYLELVYKKQYTARVSRYLEDLFQKPSAQHYNDYQPYKML